MNHTAIVDLVSEFLGFPRSYDSSMVEVEWCCPKCDKGRGKFNLVLNADKKVFHCWACKYKGTLARLVKDNGTYDHIEALKRINFGVKVKPKEPEYETLTLSGFRSMRVEWKDSLTYVAAMKYLKKRRINMDMVHQWDICYAENGKYADRIIVPSKSLDGKVEYFIARDIYDTAKLKYKNPKSRKNSVIFGEKFIDWKKPVILTEGVFDAMVLYNAVPLLGTKIKGHDKLIRKIMENKTPIILGFDQDKVGARERIGVAKYLNSLGSSLYIITDNEYNDLADAYRNGGKGYIVRLIRNAKPFDELDMAIATLEDS